MCVCACAMVSFKSKRANERKNGNKWVCAGVREREEIEKKVYYESCVQNNYCIKYYYHSGTRRCICSMYVRTKRWIEQIAVGKMFSLTITHIDFIRAITTTTMARTTTTTAATPMKTQRTFFTIVYLFFASSKYRLANGSCLRFLHRGTACAIRFFAHSSPFHRWIKKRRRNDVT